MQPTPHPLRARWLVVGAALAMAAFYAVGYRFLNSYQLGLGKLNFPDPRYIAFAAFWSFLGSIALGLLSLGLLRAWGDRGHTARLLGEWREISDRRFLVAASLAAFVLPLLLRLNVLHGAPLTDDESAYRLAAELLASGRLWVASPAMKLFYDQNFIINDGRLYPVYFLGWPAFLVPGIWLGAPGLMNPIYSALTVWPLLRALSHFVSREWARVGVVVFLAAPFIQLAAATLLSHTTCLLALTWCLCLFLDARRDPTSWQSHAGFSLAFACAFAVRPQSALPLGLPLLAAWVLQVARLRDRTRRRAAIAFALPALVAGLLFLGSLWAQNGSPFKTGYQRSAEYLAENGFRFSSFQPTDITTVIGFDFSALGEALARTGAGLFRLNFDLFGWPLAMAFLLAALPSRRSRPRLLWAMAGTGLVFLVFQRDWGVDSFGPLHAFELALPILCLTIVGSAALSATLAEATPSADPAAPEAPRWAALPAIALALSIALAWVGFVPIRWAAVRSIASQVNEALLAPERAGLHHAVIFSPLPFVPPCNEAAPRSFVLFRPVNDPDLRNDILWVNQLDAAAEKRLLETLPGRSGYTLSWTADCRVTLEPLAPSGG